MINDNYSSITSIYYFYNQKNTLRNILAVLFFFSLAISYVKGTLKCKQTFINMSTMIRSRKAPGGDPNQNHLRGDIRWPGRLCKLKDRKCTPLLKKKGIKV